MTSRCPLPSIVLVALVALAPGPGCKSRSAEPAAPAPPPIDAAAADANLDGCRAAVPKIARLPAIERARALLTACQPCGDWTTLLGWNTPRADGGPSLRAVQDAMIACHAYCDPRAKQRFLGALEPARGLPGRGPWRHLGEVCKAEVSAVPDARYLSAPYFALDRVARALGDDPRLPPLDVPLPALSLSGVGFELPEVPRAVAMAGGASLTVNQHEILLGTLPSARLTGHGLDVTGDYPGAAVDGKGLAAALARAPYADQVVAVLAPSGLAAARVIDAVRAAGRPVRLAVGVSEPTGWLVPATLPIDLRADSGVGTLPPRAVRLALGATAAPAIQAAAAAAAALREHAPVVVRAAPDATAASLAELVGALLAYDVSSAVVAATPAPAKP